MTTTHSITADITVKFQLSGMPDDERESTEVKVKISYTFVKGSPAVMYQRNGDPGWPAEPHEVELIKATMLDNGGLDPTQDQIDDWASDWLQDKGYELAVENALNRDY